MEFIINNIWLIGILLLSGGALVWPVLQRRGTKVTPLEATQAINQGKTLILDVREPADFNAGHIRDAKNIPLKELPKRIGELEKFKTRKVIVVCAAGVQSSKAAGQLKSAGFNEVYSLNGGLTAWQNQGLPITK